MVVARVRIGLGTHEIAKTIDLLLLYLIFKLISTLGKTDYCCFSFLVFGILIYSNQILVIL